MNLPRQGTAPPLPSPMQTYYAARASEYDSVYQKPERQADLRALEAWLPSRFAHTCLLEVACGTGHWTQHLAQAAAHVVAIDSAAETLDIASARLPSDKVELLVGDAYQLPSRPGGFDAAFAGFWYSHVPNNRQVEFLRGLSERLVPGARVILLDNLFVAASSSPIRETDAEGNTFQARRLKDGTSHRVLKNFPSEAQLQTVIGGLGRNGKLHRWTYFWAFEYEVWTG